MGRGGTPTMFNRGYQDRRPKLNAAQRRTRTNVLSAITLFLPIGVGARAGLIGFRALRGVRRVRTGRFGKRWQATRPGVGGARYAGDFIKTPRRGWDYSREIPGIHYRLKANPIYRKVEKLSSRLSTGKHILTGDWSGLAFSHLPLWVRMGFFGFAAGTVAVRHFSTPARSGAPRVVPQPAPKTSRRYLSRPRVAHQTPQRSRYRKRSRKLEMVLGPV